MTPHVGVCYPMMEQGSEGTYWIVQSNWQGNEWSYDDMQGLDPGDLLMIHNQWGLLEWAGIIDPSSNFVNTETHGTVHWVQKAIDPEKWCSYFTHFHPTYGSKHPYFIGTLFKNAKAHKPKTAKA